jgi:hypothetical protein
MEKQKVIYDYFVLIHSPGHPKAENGYVPEQYLVAEKHLERHLTPDEDVRHINGNTQDNDPSNLEVVSSNMGYKIISLVGDVEIRKTAARTFISCKYQQHCWKTVRAPIARANKCYLPYICSWQTEGDIYKCSHFWKFIEKQQGVNMNDGL